MILVDVWKTTPFMALLILAALQTLPKDCYEAARVDGVHPLRVFWKVTLPLIRQPLLVAVVFRLLDALRVFDLIYVLTSNDSSTISMSGLVMREMVEAGNVGFGSAASTLLFLIIMSATVLYILRAACASSWRSDDPAKRISSSAPGFVSDSAPAWWSSSRCSRSITRSSPRSRPARTCSPPTCPARNLG